MGKETEFYADTNRGLHRAQMPTARKEVRGSKLESQRNSAEFHPKKPDEQRKGQPSAINTSQNEN